MNERIKNSVNEWAKEYFSELNIIHLDEEKFVINVLNNSKKIAVFYKSLFKDDYEKILDYEDIDKFTIDYYMKKDDLDLTIDNKKLIKTYCKGFRFGDYAEYFIDYGSMAYYGEIDLEEFKIGEVSIRIGPPSETFQLIFKQLEDDKYLGDWEANLTISLKGITNDNYKSLIQQAVFYVGYCNPSIHMDEHPRLITFTGKYYNMSGFEEEEVDEMRKEFDNEIETGCFEEFKYPEVVSFYNKAMDIQQEEIAFLYFYKVLEHFFIINQREKFITNITDYNTNQNVDDFIKKTSSIYKQNEEELLKYLLHTSEEELTNVLEVALNHNLIDDKDINQFGTALYQYRNRLVHGKGDYKYTLKTPDDIDNIQEKTWNGIIQQLAKVLIFKYCLGR
jgi:hypothetical protein